MRDRPPPRLVALLERLGLATAAQVGQMGSRVRRLTRDLPQFESVWVDALAQARTLTPLQAAEINAGRGESLRIGPYLLCRREPWPDYVACYRARRFDSDQSVRLAVIDATDERATEILEKLDELVLASADLRSEHLAAIHHVGIEGDRIWAASPGTAGQTAAEWLIHNGRFPPEAAMYLAQSMVSALVALEQAGLCHGDLSTSGIVLRDDGGATLLQPGLRAILRPEEGYARADLQPEAYDYLAPERVTDGTPPTTASDLYALGCVWWHLLCGRPPLAGGNALMKLRAAQAAEVLDVRRLAPHTPEPLAAAIGECLRRDPEQRPSGMAEVKAMLGPPTRSGKAALVRCLSRRTRPALRPAGRASRVWPSDRFVIGTTAAVVCLVVASLLGPNWYKSWQTTAVDAASSHPTSSHPTANLGESHSPGREAGVGAAVTGGDVEGVSAEPRPPGRGYGERSGDKSGDSEGSGVGSGDSGESDKGPDHGVVPAYYLAERTGGSDDLILNAGRLIEASSLRLRAGQHVRGVQGQRPAILVPPGGWSIDVDDVCFENIDFVCTDSNPTGEASVVVLHGSATTFDGCSFRSAAASSVRPAAIRWAAAEPAGDSTLALPSGRLSLRDCVLHHVTAGIVCQRGGALALSLDNTLHLGTGPLIHWDRFPQADEPVRISLSQVTLRGGLALLQCSCAATTGQPGEVTIDAVGCVFAPESEAALLRFDSPTSPASLLRNMRWTGQGSLVVPEVAVAAWRQDAGTLEPLDDTAFPIAGLVRSRVEFAAGADQGPAASEVVRWQAPLQSPDPPGADPQRLPRQ